jgi:hypothetical protein
MPPAVKPGQPASPQNLVPGPFLLLPPAAAVAVPFAPFVAPLRSWPSHQLPPPTDLVIALQHFLI